MQSTVRAKAAWASIVKPGFTPEPSSTLTVIGEGVNKKELFINVPSEEVSGHITEWKSAIFGQVLGNRASFFNLKHFAETRWGSKGLLETQKVEDDLFLFRFQTESQKQDLLDRSPLPFGNRMLYLWPWKPEEKTQRLKLDYLQIWVRFPNLKLQFFNPITLGKLGSLIGEPLFMDKATTAKSRVAYARICVRVKAGDELPNTVTITDNYGVDTNQEVQYEWIPPQCIRCKSFGHNCDSGELLKRGTLRHKNDFPMGTNNGAVYMSAQQTNMDKNLEWRNRQARKWVRVEPMKTAKIKGNFVDDAQGASSPTKTKNRFEALNDTSEDVEMGNTQKLGFSEKQRRQIAEEEEKERAYYADQVAKLLDEEADSDDGYSTKQPKSPGKPGADLQTEVFAADELSSPKEAQVNECLEVASPGTSDSANFISETPEILLINDSFGEKVVIPEVQQEMNKDTENDNMINKVNNLPSPLNFNGLESPTSVAPSWQAARTGKRGGKGGRKGGKGGKGSPTSSIK